MAPTSNLFRRMQHVYFDVSYVSLALAVSIQNEQSQIRFLARALDAVRDRVCCACRGVWCLDNSRVLTLVVTPAM